MPTLSLFGDNAQTPALDETVYMVKVVWFRILSLGIWLLSIGGNAQDGHTTRPAQSALGNSTKPLVNFQVSQPLTFPPSFKPCTVSVIHHLFANSYYKPAIAEWIPPTRECGDPKTWMGVSLNYTATSNGTQYDRLSSVTFQNVEIWRTSSAEPTPGAGIIWTALKDVTHYLPLFQKPGRFILDLNNIIDLEKGLDGEFDVTFSATIYTSSERHNSTFKTSDLIIPLSNYSPDQANYVSVPPKLKTRVKFPNNTAEAYAEIYASGGAKEEFWYLNVGEEALIYLPEGTTYGQGPFREVRLFVDGFLAGVAMPYPILFTGAYVPLMWRPIPAHGAFDQPTYKIDLTPFIPLLADDREHIITLDVAGIPTWGLEPEKLWNKQWWISGNIQVILDESSQASFGRITHYNSPVGLDFSDLGVTVTDDGKDVASSYEAGHTLYIESEIITGTGKKTVMWEQQLFFLNVHTYWNLASTEHMLQNAQIDSVSTHDGVIKLRDSSSYSLSFDFSLVENDEVDGWKTKMHGSYKRTEELPLQLSSSIKTKWGAEGSRLAPKSGGGRRSSASSEHSFSYKDAAGNTYTRDVKAVNGTVSEDKQGGTLPPFSQMHDALQEAEYYTFGDGEARIHGRGKGGRVRDDQLIVASPNGRLLREWH